MTNEIKDNSITVEGELSIEEELEEFEGNGVILWPMELIQ